MLRRLLGIAAVFYLFLFALVAPAAAQTKHLALVIGNSAYQVAPPLKTPATDASIVSETLRAAGYDVTDVRDVKQADIGQVMRAFLDKVEAAGPDTVVFFYYSGHGAQSDGQNYLVPIDAVINNDAEVANEAFRLNDLTDALADLPAAARIVVLDASRDHKFGAAGNRPVPKGLAMGDAIPGTLLAFAAAPGAVSEDGDQDYSLYTGTLVTMMRQPGLDMEQIFKAARLEVNKVTDGAQTPWMVSSLPAEVGLFAANAAAPEPETIPSGARVPSKEEREVTKDMLSGLSPDDAYDVVVGEDTLEAYQWFVELYPQAPQAAQVWDIIETRREAVLWRRTLAQNTTRAYWNYLKRYPTGEHAGEAQEQLAALSAPPAPPPTYVPAPEPLPPDYYDEAVGLAEIVPEGFEAPPTVFETIIPLFIPRGPRDFGRDRDRRDRARDRGRDRFVPTIPLVRGDPVRTIGKDKTRKTDRQTGIKSDRGPTDRGVRPTDRGVRPTDRGVRPTDRGVRPTDRGVRGPKPGVTIPQKGTTGPSPTTRGPTGVPPTTRGPTGVPPTTRGPTGVPPTTRGPTGLPPTTRGPTGVAPTTRGPTGTPSTTRPGLPPVPGTTPVRPTVPSTGAPSSGQRPGLPPRSQPIRPTTPPMVRPATPPTVRPTTPPTVRPTPTRPAPTVRPTPTRPAPTARPTPTRPAPVARPAPSRPAPARPVARPAPSRPAPAARPAPQRPAPAARPAPARPAPAARPAPRAPVCTVVGGKRVCR